MTLTKQTLFYIGLFIGEVGAGGQALLLRHELVDTLPYKAMGIEIGGVYSSIAITGVWSAVIISVMVAGYLGRKTLWLTIVAPVVLSPLIFAAVFQGYSFAYGLNAEPGGGDFTILRASEQFYTQCLSLLGIGFGIAIVLASILNMIAKRRSDGIEIAD